MANFQQQQMFVQQHLPYAERMAKNLGVHPLTIIGQLALETNWGQSVLPGTNNFGNIVETRKGVQGVWANDAGNRRQFRKFNDIGDYYNFMEGMFNRKYKGVIGAADPRQYGQAMKAGGYAEDPNYARSIVNMHNAVNKVLGNKYTWNGQVTTPVPVPPANPNSANGKMLNNLSGAPVAGPVQPIEQPKQQSQQTPQASLNLNPQYTSQTYGGQMLNALYGNPNYRNDWWRT